VQYTLAGLDVLLHRIGWSIQVPARRAAERDEAAIAAWREETCPLMKGRRALPVHGPKPEGAGGGRRTRAGRRA
jgi:hypothetical protein